MRKASLVKQEEVSGEIDLTPMLDVVFIMLIFFIVTATFIREPGVDIIRPEAVTAVSVKNQNILIAITADGDIWMDKTQLEEHQIRSRIEKLRAEKPNGAVVIQADEDSTAEKVALVIDAAKKAGASDISLATLK